MKRNEKTFNFADWKGRCLKDTNFGIASCVYGDHIGISSGHLRFVYDWNVYRR